MKAKIAYCGLDCEGCDAYIATREDDQMLREATARQWSELNGITILPEHINCEGCRGAGVKTEYCLRLCPIRLCASIKEVNTCGDCPDLMRCSNVAAITGNNPDALRNLTGHTAGGD